MVSYQDPWEDDGKVWCYYDVTTTEGATTILYSTESFSAMEVDGVSQTLAKTFTFGSTGEHLVKFTLRNGSTIGNLSTTTNHAFREVNRLRRCYLPDTITTLGRLTFYQNSGVVFIKFSENITVIGGQACYRCTNLANTVLSFPHLTSFNGTQQFQSCSKVKKVTNLGTVTTIPNSCIRQMTSLTDLVLPATVTSLVDASIYGNTALKRVIIYAPTPPSRHSNVFTSSSLTSIKVLPQSVDAYKSSSAWSTFASKIYPLWEETPIAINHMSLGDFRRRIMMGISQGGLYPPEYDRVRVWAYMDVPSDQNVTISNNTAAACGWTNVEIDGVDMGTTWNNVPLTAGTHLLKFTLSNPTRLGHIFRTRNYYTKIILPPTVTTLGDSAFLNTYNKPILIMDKTKITSIEYRAFYGEGPNYGDINFPNLTTIGSQVWNSYNNPGGAKVKNLGSITALTSNLFNQSRLTIYDIPATVTEVADRAFFNGFVGTSMEITMRPTTPPTYGSNVIYRVKKIYVPAESVETYKAAAGWSSWANYIEAIPTT